MLHLERNPFGKIGVIVGMIAFGISFFHFWLGPVSLGEPVQDKTITEKVTDLKNRIIDGLSEKPVNDASGLTEAELNRGISLASIVLAFVAIVFAIISFLKKENLRFSSTAVSLGGVTIAFHFFLVALGLVVILVVLSMVFSQ